MMRFYLLLLISFFSFIFDNLTVMGDRAILYQQSILQAALQLQCRISKPTVAYDTNKHFVVRPWIC